MRGHHQSDGLLGDGGVAIALDGMDLDAERFDFRHVHVARRTGAEKHNVFEVPALPDQVGRHVRMIVDADVVIGDDARQLVLLERRGVDRDRRIVRAIDALPDLAKLGVTVDEDGAHVRNRRSVWLYGHNASSVAAFGARVHSYESWKKLGVEAGLVVD
jgi:hypothetical protein